MKTTDTEIHNEKDRWLALLGTDIDSVVSIQAIDKLLNAEVNWFALQFRIQYTNRHVALAYSTFNCSPLITMVQYR